MFEKQPKRWRRRSEATASALLPVMLPSEWGAARFHAEFHVRWHATAANPIRTAFAQDSLTRWAASISRQQSVLDAAMLQADLNASLSRGVPTAGFDLEIQHASVRIFVSEPDLRAAQERNALMQETQLTELRQKAHANQLRFIRDTVLQDPAMLMAWLLEANMSNPGEVLQHEAKLRNLAEAVSPNTVNLLGVEFAKIATTFVDRLGRPALKQLIMSISTIMASYQEDELADRLRKLDEVGGSYQPVQ